MSTYNPPAKFHPELQPHCTATVNRVLLSYNYHMQKQRMRGQGEGVVGCGDKASGIFATSAFYTPHGVDQLQKHCDTRKILDALDRILVTSPYLNRNKSAGRRWGASQAKLRGDFEEDVISAYPRASAHALPCSRTTYRSDFTTKDRCKAKSMKDTFSTATPYGELTPPEPIKSIYRQDFLQFPPRHTTPQAKAYPIPPALALPHAFGEGVTWGTPSPTVLRLRGHPVPPGNEAIPMANSVYRSSYVAKHVPVPQEECEEFTE